jgi:hypothetical protein
VAENNVSLTITVFGEVQLVFGTLAVPVAALFIGILASLAARQFRSPRRAGRAAGFVLMVTALGFERDILTLLITMERRLVLLSIVVGLAAIGVRRVTRSPWQVPEPGHPHLAEVAAMGSRR